MKNRLSRASLAIAAAVALSTTACAGGALGGLGDIIAGAAGGQPAAPQQSQISAEVRSVDTNNKTITVKTSNGQTGAVRYDANTTVVYQQQQYAVTALEQGDLVVLTVTQDTQGNSLVSRIDVTQSVQSNTNTNTSTTPAPQNVRLYNGRITQVDHDRGFFLLQIQGGTVTVSMPYNPPRATLDYFHRLRVGDTVKLEASTIGTNRVEIYRFL